LIIVTYISVYRYCGYVDEEQNERDDQSENNRDAILVFFSNNGLWLMQNSYEMHIDGTFATTPHPFKQLVFVQAKQKGMRAVPVAFALLTRKVTIFFQ
jgi:hypothetical protein